MAKTKISRKKNDPRKYAPIGLWVSAVALLATVLLLIVKFFDFAKIYTIPNPQVFNWVLAISAALVILGLASFALIDPERVRVFLTGRQAKYGSNALILLVAFLGILVVINILVIQNPGKPWDLTEGKQNSLASETIATLKNLPSKVEATAFYSSQTSSDAALKLLENYKNNSSGKFAYQFLDPVQYPVDARQKGITGDGKIYLQMGDQHEIISYASESEITSALIRLMNPSKKTIYFLTGHGEHDITASENTSYSTAKSALEAKNYTVSSLNLFAQNSIPQDASIIVIAGPMQPISSAEMTLLAEFVAKGGSLVAMEEPLPFTSFGNSTDPLAAYLTASWGVTLTNDVIVDTTTSHLSWAVAQLPYVDHPITEKLQGLASFFSTARSISISPAAPIQPTAIITTSSSSWGETDIVSLTADGKVGFDQNSDFPGPLTLATVSTDTTTGSHVIVFGDSDFASNAYFSQYANGDIFLNAIDWAAGQEQLISLSTPKAVTRSISFTSDFWLLVMAVSFLCILPGLIIAGGIIAWLIRRSRG